MVNCIFRFVCVALFLGQYFFLLCWANYFFCMSQSLHFIELDIDQDEIDALFNRRREYIIRAGRYFFMYIIIFLNFQNEWGEKSIYSMYPKKGGKHIEEERRMGWYRFKVMLCVWHFNIYYLFTSSPTYLRFIRTHSSFLYRSRVLGWICDFSPSLSLSIELRHTVKTISCNVMLYDFTQLTTQIWIEAYWHNETNACM